MPENSPSSRDTNHNAVSEQVPHSGVHGNERPVYDFDGKSLEQALADGDLHVEVDEQGRNILVPSDLGEYTDPTKTTETEVYEPLVAPQTTEKRSKIGRYIGAGVSALVLAGSGVFGYSAMNDEKPRETTSASPVDNTGEGAGPVQETEAQPETDKTPEELVGTLVADDIENLNTIPTPEVVEQVATPISAETPVDEAAVKIGQKLKVFYMTGTPDHDAPAGSPSQTAESEAEGHKLLEHIYSKSLDISTLSDLALRDGTRYNMSRRLEYYGTLEHYDVAQEKYTFATHATTWDVLSSEMTSDTTASVQIQANYITNYDALDRSELFGAPGVDMNDSFEMQLDMVIEDGEWRVLSLTS